MSPLIAALDRALRVAGEDINLRRRFGEAPNETFATVTCRARVDRQVIGQSPAGILLTKYSLILSPTQINEAGWPGAVLADQPDADPRIPRENDTDDVIIRGERPRVITVCDAKVIGGELVRINLECVG
ncbi:hypothetical protein [Bradyrhizobium sp. SRS-191]|uniref:hypothetical protein n=1 Tax=Bradyrhizobium sp. SRS-191 TaxID=2962606 RepID=UPI00211EAF91|nr:hypothetical protein [Bradyrhizobium sp. SRS-191]